MIADAFLQQILMRPAEYDVIATLNLNGDYISDALAAQVGGIGIAPGANLSDTVAMFEATHGTAPKYAGQDKVNPGSLILSAEMMLRHIGWVEAADLIIDSLGAAISDKQVTYDFARLMDDANEISTSGVRAGDDRPHVALLEDRDRVRSCSSKGSATSDAVETLAERRGRDLDAEGVAVLPIGGAQAIGRFVARFGPRGARRAAGGAVRRGRGGRLPPRASSEPASAPT